MSALPEPAASPLIQLSTAPNTVTVLMWLPATRTLRAALMRVRPSRNLPRMLMSATVRFQDLEDAVTADAGTLGLNLAGVQLCLSSPANLRCACEWLDMHGVYVRAAKR